MLLGEYLSEDLLLNLPHRQFVWTIPKVLRSFLRHDRSLFADIGRLIFSILCSYFSQAAGRPIQGAMVSCHQAFGSFAVWNPHWHTIVLEGGFDRYERPAESEIRPYTPEVAPLRILHRERDTVTWKAPQKGYFNGVRPAAAEPGKTAPPSPHERLKIATVGKPRSLLPMGNPLCFMMCQQANAGGPGRVFWPSTAGVLPMRDEQFPSLDHHPPQSREVNR